MSNRSHALLAGKLVAVAIVMFVFGVFAMPPLYDRFCELTGIGQAGIAVADAAPGARAQPRTVKVRFVATANSALDWDFRALDKRMDVTLGEASEARYAVTNREGTAVSGQAVYNVTPPEAGRHFVKTECFCFTRQVLEADERREMPVYFYIEEDLPAEISEVTLAYTFFKLDDPPGGNDRAP